MEVASLEVGEGQEGEGEEAQLVGRLDTPGHRSDVRTVAFSSDNTALLTASAESLKVRQIGVPYLLINTWSQEIPGLIQEDKSDPQKYFISSIFDHQNPRSRSGFT